MAQFADEYTSEQDSYRAWQQEQARRAAQAEAAARARAQEQAQAAARAAVAERERAAVQARAAEQARARAAAQVQAARRARAEEQARETTSAETAARERAAVQARADEQARARAAAQAEAAARARVQQQTEATARAQATERERAAVQARADEQARAQVAAQAEAVARARAEEEAREAARAQAAERERAAVGARAAEPGPPPRGTPAYDAYLQEMLNARTQGIASGTGSISEPGEPARRTGPKELTLAQKLADGFIPGSGAAAPPTARTSSAASEASPPPRGTAAYDAYLTEMLNATTQAIASGVGSISEPGEPARRGGARELTLAEKLRDGFVPGGGARPAVKVSDESSRVGPPPADTPEYYAYLRAMIDGTPQGIAPGIGSFSEPGEPARRGGARELTLSEKLADGFTPAADGPREPRPPSIGDLSEEEKREFRNTELRPVAGPGAWMIEPPEDEQAVFALQSTDAFVPELLIEIYKRGTFRESELAFAEGYSPEAQQRAWLIAYFENQGLLGERYAGPLRTGAALPDGSGDLVPEWVEDFAGVASAATGDTAEWLFDQYVKSVELDLEMQEAQREVFFESLERGGRLTGDWFATAWEFLGESTEELIETLDSVVETGCEGRERLHQALLGAYTAGAPGVSESERQRFAAGLSGKATYDRENNPFRADGVPAGGTRATVAEWATDPLMIAAAVAFWGAGPQAGLVGGLIQQIVDQECDDRLGT